MIQQNLFYEMKRVGELQVYFGFNKYLIFFFKWDPCCSFLQSDNPLPSWYESNDVWHVHSFVPLFNNRLPSETTDFHLQSSWRNHFSIHLKPLTIKLSPKFCLNNMLEQLNTATQHSKLNRHNAYRVFVSLQQTDLYLKEEVLFFWHYMVKKYCLEDT